MILAEVAATCFLLVVQRNMAGVTRVLLLDCQGEGADSEEVTDEEVR